MSAESRSAGRWLLIAVLVIVGLVGGVAIGLALAGDGDLASPPSSSPTSSESPGTGGEDLDKITAGEGGTRKAADGKTPLGYSSSCVGAVQAATNFSIADARGAWIDPRTGSQVYQQMTLKGSDARLAGLLQGQKTGRDLKLVDVAHPEWGAFRLDRCQASSAARVVVFSAWIRTHPERTFRQHFDMAFELVWSEGDWKLAAADRSIDVVPDDPDGDDGVGSASAVPAAERRSAIDEANRKIPAGQPIWREYANAPR